jgi:hypothetical protein
VKLQIISRNPSQNRTKSDESFLRQFVENQSFCRVIKISIEVSLVCKSEGVKNDKKINDDLDKMY